VKINSGIEKQENSTLEKKRERRGEEIGFQMYRIVIRTKNRASD